MADRMVYVVDALPSAKGQATVEVITAEQLAEELAAGWEIVAQVDGKTIPWSPAPKRPILGERTILRKREDNRGLSVAGGHSAERKVTLHDDYGRPRTLSIEEAMGDSMRQLALSIRQQSEGVGHLGSAGRHDIPGVTVISASTVAKAFDVGLQAGIAGVDRSHNPFPPGTEAHNLWLNGYVEADKHKHLKPADTELARAYEEGMRTAKRFGPDDVVTCPYYGALKEEWIRGFKDGGGTVDSRSG